MSTNATIAGNLVNLIGSASAGTIVATLVNTGSVVPYTSDGTINSLSTTFAANGSGAYSQALYSTAQITPSGTYYQFEVYSPTGAYVTSLSASVPPGTTALEGLTQINTSPPSPTFPYVTPSYLSAQGYITGKIGINTQTSNYTLQASDLNTLVRMNSSSANNVTVASASYASQIAYIRVGGTTGGQSSPNAANALLTEVSPQTYSELMSTFMTYIGQIQSAILSAGTSFVFDQGCSGGLGTFIPDISYEWDNGAAALAISNGIGFGGQGIGKADITAYNTYGAADGGSNTSGYPSNNWVYLNSVYPQAIIKESQTDAASDPAGGDPVGSLVTLVPFAVSHGTTSLELYYSDWQVAYDPTSEYYSEYGAAYASAIQTARNGLPC